MGLVGVLLWSPVQGVDALPTVADLSVMKMMEESREKSAAADQAFENSELLRELRARSEANKQKNKKAIQNKYCLRQAELGIGDCADLKDVPEVLEELKQLQQNSN